MVRASASERKPGTALHGRSWFNNWPLSVSCGPQAWRKAQAAGTRSLCDTTGTCDPARPRQKRDTALRGLAPAASGSGGLGSTSAQLPCLFSSLLDFNERSSAGSSPSATPVLWGAGPVLAGHRGGLEPRLLWFSPPSFSCENTAQEDYAGGLINLAIYLLFWKLKLSFHVSFSLISFFFF